MIVIVCVHTWSSNPWQQ